MKGKACSPFPQRTRKKVCGIKGGIKGEYPDAAEGSASEKIYVDQGENLGRLLWREGTRPDEEQLGIGLPRKEGGKMLFDRSGER